MIPKYPKQIFILLLFLILTPPVFAGDNPFGHELKPGEKPPEGSAVISDPHAKAPEPAPQAPAAKSPVPQPTYQGSAVNPQKPGEYVPTKTSLVGNVQDEGPGVAPGTWIHAPEGGDVIVTKKDGSKETVHLADQEWYLVPEDAAQIEGDPGGLSWEEIDVYQGDPKYWKQKDQDDHFKFKKDIGKANQYKHDKDPEPMKFQIIHFEPLNLFGDGVGVDGFGPPGPVNGRDIQENRGEAAEPEQRDAY